MRLLAIIAVLLCGADWITAPSTYTHYEGVRVSQYQPLPKIYGPELPRKWGYRYHRSTIGADTFVEIEDWGLTYPWARLYLDNRRGRDSRYWRYPEGDWPG